jgi:hypothetical protein
MDNNLMQILLVLFLGGIATYDTLRSRKRSKDEDSCRSKEELNLQN